MSWNPKPVWVAADNLKDVEEVRYIDEVLSVVIHRRETDKKYMVGFLDKNTKKIWIFDGEQFLDLCLYIATEVNNTKIDGNDIVYQATLKVYNICGLVINQTGKLDKIYEIEERYKPKIPEHAHRPWKMYINSSSIFFYSQDNYKPDGDTPYGRMVEMCGIKAVLHKEFPVPPKHACKIFEYETGFQMGQIPRDKMNIVMKKYDVPPNICKRNKDGKQKNIDDAWE